MHKTISRGILNGFLALALALSPAIADTVVTPPSGGSTIGVIGPKGDRGATWFNGSGAPSSISGAAQGDYYLNGATGDVYVFNSGSWGSPVVNIRGPIGATGATGASGPRGATWFTGSGAPSSSVGVDGDYAHLLTRLFIKHNADVNLK